MPTTAVYATREDVQEAADYKETARNGRRIDRALDAGSRSVEALCHRVFYPHQDSKLFDWPNGQYARPWRLWLDANDLISFTEVSSGGYVFPPDVVLLEPNVYGPPFNQVQLDISKSSGWVGGFTHQRDISITGLWGYTDRHTTAGATTAALDDAATLLDVDGEASADLGVGSVLRVDAEQLLAVGRRAVATGQALAADITAMASAIVLTVQDGSSFAPGEQLLVDGERMYIVDVAADTLVVKRAWDGSVLAAHTAGAAVFAARRIVVQRGALGSTASAHDAGATVERWHAPPLVRQLTIAEALMSAGLESAAYAVTLRTGDGSSQRARDTGGITDLRQRTYTAHGRMARLRGV